MRRFVRGLALVAMLLTLLPAATIASSAAPTATPMVEELVILTREGRIQVHDVSAANGTPQILWQSPDTGWTDVATGDFNGDGDDEILASRGGEARVFDPVQIPGRPVVVFAQLLTGFVWEQMATGDVNGDGRDEIILTRNTNEQIGNNQIIERLQVFAPNDTATGWTLILDDPTEVPWRKLATGDVDADAREELMSIRSLGVGPGNENRLSVWNWNPGNSWNFLSNSDLYAGRWLAVQAGKAIIEGNNRSQIIATRGDVSGSQDSYLVFRCCNEPLEAIERERYNPPFTWIALGDVNDSGDEEVFLLRNASNTGSPGFVALIGINYGSDPTVPFQTLQGEGRFNGIQAGDTDNDGRAEVVIMSANEYRVYTQPASNTNSVSYFGNYATSGVFAIGDVFSRPPGPALALSVSSIDLTLQAGQGASRTVEVTNSGDSTVLNWTASVTQGGSWLTVSPANGVTPGSFTANINTTTLLAGTYTGRISVSATPNVSNSPLEIPVNLTVTAPQFSVTPTQLSWTVQQGQSGAFQTVALFGQDIPWSAGLVPIEQGQRIVEAVKAGAAVKAVDGGIAILDGASPEVVPVVDWIDVSPARGSSSTTGAPVIVSLVGNRVPHGYSEVALVFVAERVANPPAVVVWIKVLSIGPNDKLIFIPSVLRP